MVKNLPFIAGDVDLIPGRELKAHTSQGNHACTLLLENLCATNCRAQALQLLSPHALEPMFHIRSLCAATGGRAHVPQRRLRAAKKILKVPNQLTLS